MKIYIGADHNGFDYKTSLTEVLKGDGHEVVDCGDLERNQNDDFPQFASQVVAALRADNDQQARGILVCGSGQGMAMAANRFKGIRASLCWDQEEARSARNDDDSNVLCLSARSLDLDATKSIVNTWLTTPFAGAPRYERRIKELDELGG
jgi:ribose 5-phosphate isomerase B